MVRRLLEQETAVRIVLSSDRKTSHLVLTWQDLEVLESLAKVLSPLAELTDSLSGKKMATISSVIPVLHNIADKILKEEDTDSDLKQKIIKSLHDKYGYGESFEPPTEMREVLEISTFLDPRFKTDYCTDDESKRNFIDLVKSKAKSITAMITREETSNVATIASNGNEPPSNKRTLLEFLQKSTSANEEREIMTEEEKLEKEIEAYLHCPQLPISSSTSLLEWWIMNEIFYRHLSALSKKYFCTCATSVPSERTFSTSGNIVSSKRTTTKPDKVNMLPFLAKNLK